MALAERGLPPDTGPAPDKVPEPAPELELELEPEPAVVYIDVNVDVDAERVRPVDWAVTGTAGSSKWALTC